MAWKNFKRAYYGGNYGGEYSRSRRAQAAEDNGRYPKTKAAKELGVSTAAFDAGRHHADIYSTEWHHVGKYAQIVDFFDTEEIKNNSLFWKGVALFYKSKKKAIEFFRRAWQVEHQDMVPPSRQLTWTQ